MTALVIFSHPNHELAIFGLLQQLRPHIVYLTDGGGEPRVAQTRQGLEAIGLLDHAHFLNHTEESFYDALLARDSRFYGEVTEEIRSYVQAQRPGRILCDAIEFYNPVHDMSLPLVRAALRGSANPPVFEVPLVYQRAVEGESYEVQRMPARRRKGQVEFRLSHQELVTKLWARDHIYTILTEQMGPLITELPHEHIALEVISPASESLPQPGTDVALRYERRAQILAQRKQIQEEITLKRHYLPVTSSLLKTYAL